METDKAMRRGTQQDVWRGTLSGLVAILLWSSLALLVVRAGAVPPFQLITIAFTTAFVIAVVRWRVANQSIRSRLRQPPGAWLLGVSSLFGFHALLFYALQHAPPIEANLINYLWPLLIVLFSAALPGEQLRPRHVVGALFGLAGTALLLTGSGGFNFSSAHAAGYAAALASAVTWAGYSVLNRRYRQVPADAVGGFCLVGALLALAAHLAFESTLWPVDTLGWAALAGLGLGPAGGAFFFWDHAVKHGNIRLLGVWSYSIPLLSTLLLVAAGIGELTGSVAGACLLILGGAVIAARRA